MRKCNIFNVIIIIIIIIIIIVIIILCSKNCPNQTKVKLPPEKKKGLNFKDVWHKIKGKLLALLHGTMKQVVKVNKVVE